MSARARSRRPRTTQQRRAHYEIERELADRLRNAGKEERRHLYTALYDELFRRVPDHPLLTDKVNATARNRETTRQLRLLKRFLNRDTTFLEIGSGNCSLSVEVARRVKKVYTVDVSTEVTKGITCPANLELIISDGTSIPVEHGSIDLAYSNQLMEHLHPEDALEQLRNIHAALRSGGSYLCITPNRINGPHDISRLFDRVATGFHLKEYTNRELKSMLETTGFSRFSALVLFRGFGFSLPLTPIEWFEWMLSQLPYPLHAKLARLPPFRVLLGVSMVATK